MDVSVIKSNLTNRENRIHFLYKCYLLKLSQSQSLVELHENSYSYDFTKKEEESIKILLENIDKYEKLLIDKLPDNWKIDRLNIIEKSVLINAIFEMIEFENKKSIIINESLNYIHKYSEKSAVSLVNGILDKIN